MSTFTQLSSIKRDSFSSTDSFPNVRFNYLDLFDSFETLIQFKINSFTFFARKPLSIFSLRISCSIFSMEVTHFNNEAFIVEVCV